MHQLKNKQSHFSELLISPNTELLGNSPQIKAVLTAVDKVARTDANVLLLGENGTGKELIAKLIHQQSLRKNEPFVKIDVGAISSTLFESELFGHKKGAFTDAREDRTGKMELANGGSLFLDEVGNLPLSLQVKLLSALQNREVVPLGRNDAIPINIRLICATNLDIHQAVSEACFREDLLYRINTIEIVLPPLRDRVGDIPLLANHFLETYSTKYRKENKTISDETMAYLQRYHWPGNIRELQHAVERAVIMSERNILSKQDFFLGSREKTDKNQALNLDDMERKTIFQAIQKYNGNLSKVAKELGVGRTTLYRKMVRYGIEK